MATPKRKKQSDIFSGIGRERVIRLNHHDVTIIEPKRIISFKEGQKRIRKLLE